MSDYHTEDVILALWNEWWAQPSARRTETQNTRGNQAGSGCWGPGDGDGGSTLPPLQVRTDLRCWEACTMLQTFPAVKAKMGSSWPSNLTCCLTQTTELLLSIPLHIVLSFLPYVYFSVFFFFSSVCLFLNTKKLQIASSLLFKQTLCFLKPKQNLERKQHTPLPCLPILLPNQCHRLSISNRDYMIQSTL